MYKRLKDYKGKSTPERFELLTKSESRIMRLTGQGYSTGDILGKSEKKAQEKVVTKS